MTPPRALMWSQELTTTAYFQRLSELIPRLPYDTIDAIVAALLNAHEDERTLFAFGNGGSAATASHMLCDLNKRTTEAREKKPLRVMSLTDNVPLLTAWANDSSYEQVFSEQIKTFVRQGDLAFALSASGNSPNVLHGLRTARERGAVTLGLSGCQGGKMHALCDICAVVPSDNIQMIEDMHHAILHSIFTVFGEKLRARAPGAP